MSADATEKVSLNSAHRCLAHERRRTVVTYLRDLEDETASLFELTDHIVAQETNDFAPDRAAVTAELYHLHLPMLADEGVLDFDSRTKTVAYSGCAVVERLLDAV